ncbi:hormone-sensitive lipase [Anaeramoeba flamelloides]|uniref:Hormone-sensitive lipase n=1 Tax=Anaeramoeba flamelloides TaxID=1746091 RepID=A0ABQ8ZFE8_9EUKA|nr:hormone-sensitive lipase [Anaeramoeba flamelloides]
MNFLKEQEITRNSDFSLYSSNSILGCIQDCQEILIRKIEISTEFANKNKKKQTNLFVKKSLESYLLQLKNIKKLFKKCNLSLSFPWEDVIHQLRSELSNNSDQKHSKKVKTTKKSSLLKNDLSQVIEQSTNSKENTDYVYYPQRSWSYLSLSIVIRLIVENFTIQISKKKISKKLLKKMDQYQKLFQRLACVLIFFNYSLKSVSLGSDSQKEEIKDQKKGNSDLNLNSNNKKNKKKKKKKKKYTKDNTNVNTNTNMGMDDKVSETQGKSRKSNKFYSDYTSIYFSSESQTEEEINKTQTKKNKKQSQQLKDLDLAPHEIFFIDEREIEKELKEISELKNPCEYYFVHQFEKSFKKLANYMHIAYSSCHFSYKSSNIVAKRIIFGLNAVRYFFRLKTGSRKAAQIKKDCSIEYLLSIWNSTESNKFVRWVVFQPFPRIKFERLRYISRTDTECKLSKSKNGFENPIPIRIISSSKKPFATKKIVLHIHGGGFISQTSFAHGPYLREWAKQTGCTVVSVDYTNPPKERFPFQIKECYQTYLWLVKKMPDCKLVLAGDSAGGCFALLTFIKIFQKEIVKRPDALLLAYPVTNLNSTFGLSRIMFSNDPVFSYSILKTCLNSCLPLNQESNKKKKKKKKKDKYLNDSIEDNSLLINNKLNSGSGSGSESESESESEFENESKTNISEKNLINTTYSPLYMDDKYLKAFPKTLILGGLFDPLLDEYSLFADRLKIIKHKDFQFRVYPLPHAFWSLGGVLKQTKIPLKHTIDFLKSVYDD